MGTKHKPCFKLLPGHLAEAVAGSGAGPPQDSSDVLKPSDHQGQGQRTGPVPSTQPEGQDWDP